MSNDRYELMKKIRDEIMELESSPLYQYRLQNKNYPVIGEGNHTAHIMFVGEAPGKNEAETGRPFCGRSGNILDLLIASIGINRQDVYITNVVKDRPPGNRDPLPEEIEIYAPFLDRQIEIIQPKVIATLGRFSMDYIFKKFNLEDVLSPISKLHGKSFKVNTPHGEMIIVALYHPAVAVYNASMLDTLKKDFEVLKNAI